MNFFSTSGSDTNGPEGKGEYDSGTGPSIIRGQYVARSFTRIIVSSLAGRVGCSESNDDKDDSIELMCICGDAGYDPPAARCGNAGTVVALMLGPAPRSCSSRETGWDMTGEADEEAASESLSETCALSRDAANELDISGSDTYA